MKLRNNEVEIEAIGEPYVRYRVAACPRTDGWKCNKEVRQSRQVPGTVSRGKTKNNQTVVGGLVLADVLRSMSQGR